MEYYPVGLAMSLLARIAASQEDTGQKYSDQA